MIAPISWMAVFCIENKMTGKRGWSLYVDMYTCSVAQRAWRASNMQERRHMDPATSDALQLQSEILGNLIVTD